MKLLIGYDGSNDANAAIEDLAYAGLPHDVEALIVSVCGSPTAALFANEDIIESAAVGDRGVSIVRRAKMRVSEQVQRANEMVLNAYMRLQSKFPSWKIRGAVLSGNNPAVGLIKEARTRHADLIVVGSQGRSAIGRLILGSVSFEVATKAGCSVRVGRRTTREFERGQLRILLGLDCSPGAEKAVRKVLMRAWPEGTELRVLAVEDGVSTITADKTSASSQQVREDIRVLEGKAINIAESKGLTISAGIKEGDPVQILIAEAREWEADCVVVGSRGTSKSSSGFFGKSVSAGLAARAQCSIEIVR